MANKLVILHAVREALHLAGDVEGEREVLRLREETQAALDDILDQAPEVMTGLVTARALEPSYDLRTRGATPGAGPERAPAGEATPINGRATAVAG